MLHNFILQNADTIQQKMQKVRSLNFLSNKRMLNIMILYKYTSKHHHIFASRWMQQNLYFIKVFKGFRWPNSTLQSQYACRPTDYYIEQLW